MSDRNHSQIDQSAFYGTTEQMQAPPEELERMEYIRQHKKELSRKRLKVLLGFLSIVTVVSVGIALIPEPTPPPPAPAPTPTPTLAPAVPKLLEIELQKLESVTNQANPSTEPFVPPAVDMKVRF